MNDFLEYKDDPILFELAIRLNLLGIPKDNFNLSKIENQHNLVITLPDDVIHASWKCDNLDDVEKFPERATRWIVDMLIHRIFKEK